MSHILSGSNIVHDLVRRIHDCASVYYAERLRLPSLYCLLRRAEKELQESKETNETSAWISQETISTLRSQVHRVQDQVSYQKQIFFTT